MKRETPDRVVRIQRSSSSVFAERSDDSATMDSIREGILILKNNIQRWTSMNETDTDSAGRFDKLVDSLSSSSKSMESTDVASRRGKENIEKEDARDAYILPEEKCRFGLVASLHSK